MLIHIPHSSFEIPEKYRASFLLTEEELKLELLKMTDSYTDELFHVQFQKIVFPISRLVCDVERFRDDSEEVMAKCGMGVIYTATSDNRVLKNVDEEMRKEIIRDYYDTHHFKFLRLVSDELDCNGLSLIVDAHSFPSKPLPYETNQSQYRPDYCIGVDKHHTPSDLVSKVMELLQGKGYRVDINNPYSGSIVPIDFNKNSKNVLSIMIEVNRKLYMDEDTGKKNYNFFNTKKNIDDLINLIKRWEGDNT